MGLIDVDFQTLQDQAPSTINSYLNSAREAAKDFGIPASERTQFYCAYIAACTSDFNQAALSKVISHVASELTDVIERSLLRDDDSV